MNEIRCWLHVYLFMVVIFCYSPVPGGAVESCDVSHAFHLTNDTTGVTITYTNTHDCDVDNVTFVGRFLPSQPICGERNDRCGMSSMSNSDETILVIAFPLDGGLGLVSYELENSTYFFREKKFKILTQSIADCTLAFFVPFPLRSNNFIGYCLDLSSHMIRHVFVEIVFEMLANSRVYSNNFYAPFDIQSNSFLSNFLNIVNRECFTTDNGHVVFLHNSNLLDHSLDDAEYMSHGSIGVEACSTSEPRLQRLGSECKLAAYCNGTTAIFGTPEDFTSSGQVVDRLATEADELAFVCSSLNYILFRNKTLSVRELSSGNQIGNSFPFDTESILLGDCLVSQQQFYFVAALSNNSKFFVNFSARSSYSLAESGNYTTPTPYLVQDKLLFVNNGTHTLIRNWTRMSEDDFSLSLPINFDLVLSFVTASEQCGCVGEDPVATTTEPAPEVATTTVVTNGPNTVAMTTTMDSSVSTTTNSSASTDPTLSTGQIVGIVVAVVTVIVLLVIAAVVFCIIVVYCFVRAKHTSDPITLKKQENLINNNNLYQSIEMSNNNELYQQGLPPPDSGPPSTPPKQDGETTDVEVHPDKEKDPASSNQNQDDTLTEDDGKFPVTTTAVPQHTSPTHPTNDTMLVASTATVSSHHVHALHNTSPNVNTIAKVVTEIGPNTADVVSPSVTSAVRPHPDTVDEQKKEMEQRHDERYGNGVPSNERR